MKTLLISLSTILLLGAFVTVNLETARPDRPSDYLEIGQWIYPNHADEFTAYFEHYLADQKGFAKEHKSVIKQYAIENVTSQTVTYLFGDSRKLLAYIDWEGEEYEFEVDEYLHKSLYGEKVAWTHTEKHRYNVPTEHHRDGEFIIDLFIAIDKDLAAVDKQLLFFKLDFGAYAFIPVSKTVFKQVLEKAPRSFHGSGWFHN